MSDQEQDQTFKPEQIGQMDGDWLLCRELGHPWKHQSFAKAADGPGFIRVLKCPRCETTRHDRVSHWGHVVGRRYEYPGGYTLKGVSDFGISRSDFRREVMRRAGLDGVRARKWEQPDATN